MKERITTVEAAAIRHIDTAYSAASPGASASEGATRTIDVVSFLFLIFFQCGAALAIAVYSPQIGQMGLVVFGIIFVWLGATLIIGVMDIWLRPGLRRKS